MKNNKYLNRAKLNLFYLQLLKYDRGTSRSRTKNKKKEQQDRDMSNDRNEKESRKDAKKNRKEKYSDAVEKFNADKEEEPASEEEEEPAFNDFGLEYFKALKFDVLKFIQNPPPLDTLIRCKVKINRGIFTSYTMFLEQKNEHDTSGKKDSVIDLPLMTSKSKKVSAKIFHWIFVYDNNSQSVSNKHDQDKTGANIVKFGN